VFLFAAEQLPGLAPAALGLDSAPCHGKSQVFACKLRACLIYAKEINIHPTLPLPPSLLPRAMGLANGEGQFWLFTRQLDHGSCFACQQRWDPPAQPAPLGGCWGQLSAALEGALPGLSGRTKNTSRHAYIDLFTAR